MEASTRESSARWTVGNARLTSYIYPCNSQQQVDSRIIVHNNSSSITSCVHHGFSEYGLHSITKFAAFTHSCVCSHTLAHIQRAAFTHSHTLAPIHIV
jgi:hypothetical protein